MEATDSDDRYHTVGADARPLDGYGAVELDDGEIIVYDLDDEGGWVQSSDWIGLAFMA